MKESTRIRIAVVSEDLVEPWDEGIKKFTSAVAQAFARAHDVLIVNVDVSGVGSSAGIVRVPGTKTFRSSALRKVVRDFKPDWVLYVPSPSNTLASNARATVLSKHVKAPVIMVALIPRTHEGWRGRVARTFAPALTLVPSYRSLLHLSRLGVKGDVLPVGVDVNEFSPISRDACQALRNKLGLGVDKFVYLHVGHTRPRRNVVALTALANQADVQIVTIASTSTPESAEVRAQLDRAGVRVIREFVNVSDYYRAADCYVFPVHDHDGCVEMPLSVLEALSCGLPVLTTPFGGLPDFFYEGDDLKYWRNPDELVHAADRMRASLPVQTRSMDDFSWDRIAQRILTHAEAL